jgi:nucleotidyltransferase/DNA polymerase involved in DNA repair
VSLQPVEEIWGVGRRISKTLGTMGITTALQLARAIDLHPELQRGTGEERFVN